MTFNHDNDYAFFRPRVRKLEDEGHNPEDWKSACEKALMWGDEIYIGKFLHVQRPTLDDQEPVLEEGGPIGHRSIAISNEQSEAIIKRMM